MTTASDVERRVRDHLYGEPSGKVHRNPDDLRPAFQDEWSRWQDELEEADRNDHRQRRIEDSDE